MIFVYIPLFISIAAAIVFVRFIYKRDIDALNDVLYEKTRTVQILQDYSTELEKTRDLLKKQVSELNKNLDVALNKLKQTPETTTNENATGTAPRKSRGRRKASNSTNK